jgi:hypothetical protein
MVHSDLYRIRQLDLYSSTESRTRLPSVRPILPTPVQEVVSVDVRLSSRALANVHLRPGLIVDYYA